MRLVGMALLSAISCAETCRKTPAKHRSLPSAAQPSASSAAVNEETFPLGTGCWLAPRSTDPTSTLKEARKSCNFGSPLWPKPKQFAPTKTRRRFAIKLEKGACLRFVGLAPPTTRDLKMVLHYHGNSSLEDKARGRLAVVEPICLRPGHVAFSFPDQRGSSVLVQAYQIGTFSEADASEPKAQPRAAETAEQ